MGPDLDSSELKQIYNYRNSTPKHLVMLGTGPFGPMLFQSDSAELCGVGAVAGKELARHSRSGFAAASPCPQESLS